MLEILAVRHGQTTLNEQSIVIGHLNVPLSTQGRRDAGEIGRRLKAERFDAIVSSDLLRAMETAKIIRESLVARPEIVSVPALREIDYGELTKRKKSEVRAAHSEYHREVHYRNPGGETFGELYKRVVEAVKALEGEHRRILIVTHAGCIRALYAFLKGERLEDHLTMRLSHQVILQGLLENGKPENGGFLQR